MLALAGGDHVMSEVRNLLYPRFWPRPKNWIRQILPALAWGERINNLLSVAGAVSSLSKFYLTRCMFYPDRALPG